MILKIAFESIITTIIADALLYVLQILNVLSIQIVEINPLFFYHEENFLIFLIFFLADLIFNFFKSLFGGK